MATVGSESIAWKLVNILCVHNFSFRSRLRSIVLNRAADKLAKVVCNLFQPFDILTHIYHSQLQHSHIGLKRNRSTSSSIEHTSHATKANCSPQNRCAGCQKRKKYTSWSLIKWATTKWRLQKCLLCDGLLNRKISVAPTKRNEWPTGLGVIGDQRNEKKPKKNAELKLDTK